VKAVERQVITVDINKNNIVGAVKNKVKWKSAVVQGHDVNVKRKFPV
jgi:hypothetical protein